MSKLLDQRHILDTAHVLEDRLDRLTLLLEGVEVRTEDLHCKRAFQPRLRLVDGVLGGLRVVERDARKGTELFVQRGDQLSLVVDRTAPLRIRLKPDEEFGIEEAGRIGPVIGSAMLRSHHGHFRKGGDDRPDLRHDLGRFIEGDRVGHGGTHPQRAFVEVGHELGADVGKEQQRSDEQRSGGEDGRARPGEAEIEASDISGPDTLEDRIAPLAHAAPQEPKAEYRQQR